ncbi:transglycosylase domain-containing protein [Streptomyces otsuchiensis]|uniref:transglycosylase domain-containing protein n=1 Tax=Streptomyces otsuchiensis TaxID=2681388 RepID=UPI0015841052|nr:transglycosylase domain-containing protein [Streptomyces otsuchiensis]
MSDQSGPNDTAGQPRRWSPRPDRPPGRRRGWRRLIPGWRTTLTTLAAFTVLLAGLLVAGYLLVEIPEPKSDAAAQGNVYLYADGSVIARTGDVNRESVPLSRVPDQAREAVLAAEDRDFYSTSAVDPKAMIRAGWNMLRGEGRQSGSTITQQYVKNYYLDQRQTVTRKAKEFVIAVKLDREVSKDEILEGYLNTSYFGRSAYGIQAAAQAYYDKDVDQLGTAESAYLATLLNAPSAYDVEAGPQHRARALSRWNYVLDGMVSEGWLPSGERETMAFPEPVEHRPQSALSGQRGYLVEAVNQHLAARGILDEQRLATGGVRVTTTLDPARQEALGAAVDDQLTALLDEERSQDAAVRAGAASVDIGTGAVVALYGGSDYTEQFISAATRRDYQAASTFKPFVYAAALENRSTNGSGDRIGPGTTYSGASGREVISPDGSGTGWSPENEQDTDYGTLTVSEAMDRSVNAVFAQMGVDVGPEVVRDTAIALGLPESTPGLEEAAGSISLGTSTPSPLDLAHAYATLASHGERRPLVLVTEVTVGDEAVEVPAAEPQRALSREAADATTEVLLGVVDGGTGSAASEVGRPAAGKTGTAEQDKAAWFAGYTPDLATVVALMGQDPETGTQTPMYGALGMERVNGGGVPARIWAQYTAAALEGTPVQDFDLRTGGITDGPSGSPDATPSSGTPSGAPSSGPGTAPEEPGDTPSSPPDDPDEPGQPEPAEPEPPADVPDPPEDLVEPEQPGEGAGN